MPNLLNLKRELLVEHSLAFVVESSEVVSLPINESGEGDKKYADFLKLKGVFQKGNYPNGNKRIYKTELLAREVNRFQSRITQGLALGKIYHPGFFDPGGPAGVTDVSHRVTMLQMDGDIVRGELLVFKTSSGKDVEAIVDGGGTIGISSRGYGSAERYDKVSIGGVEYKDVFMIGDDYKLDTFDLVLSPSVKTALMKPVKENFSNNEKSNSCNEQDEHNDNGGMKFMTVEELKSLHPETYNKVRDAAIKEGEERGVSITKVQVALEYKEKLEANEAEISSLKKENTTLSTENKTLQGENVTLKEKVEKVEAEKLALAIKTAVIEAVEKSSFKQYFKEEDIAYIACHCAKIEDVSTEIGAREKVYESAIEIFKAQKTTNSMSRTLDTSENGAGTDKKIEEKEYADSQRSLAFD